MGGDSGGGGGAGGTIGNDLVTALKTPQWQQAIPVAMRSSLDPVLAKAYGAWSEADRRVICNLLDWAIMSGK